MILSSDEIRVLIQEHGLISPCSEARVEHIEGCAFDLRLSRVERRDLMSSPAVITRGYRKVPKYIECPTDENGLWILAPKSRYRLTSVEAVSMPDDIRGEVQLRRTLPECGLLPFCTGVAPGYMGTLGIIVYNVDPFPVTLGPDALFATLELRWISEGKTDPYRGPRQHNQPLLGRVRPV